MDARAWTVSVRGRCVRRGGGEQRHVWRGKGVNAAGSGRWLPGALVAGTPGPACGAVCGGELPGGERHSETFERRQTLPLSTLTPTISPKKALNPLLPGQARGKVSADSQLPSLPRLIPFGQVNNSIGTSLLLAPGFRGDLPQSPEDAVFFLPGGLSEAEGVFSGLGLSVGSERTETRLGTRRKRAALGKGGSDGPTRAPWGGRCPGARE